jgi:hypothetical protein
MANQLRIPMGTNFSGSATISVAYEFQTQIPMSLGKCNSVLSQSAMLAAVCAAQLHSWASSSWNPETITIILIGHGPISRLDKV